MVEAEVEVDVEIKSTADKFFMFSRRSQHASKATRYVQGCDLLEGEWGEVGSILLWKLTVGNESIIFIYVLYARRLTLQLWYIY